VILAPEIGGRIVELAVAEGDAVASGQIIARLDDSLIRLQLAQADASVVEAEARLAQIKAAVRPEDIALAEARVDQAQAAADAAESALQDAIRLRDNPQELDVQIAQAQAALAEAQAHARTAKHQAQAADLEAQMWGEIARDLANGVAVTLPDATASPSATASSTMRPPISGARITSSLSRKPVKRWGSLSCPLPLVVQPTNNSRSSKTLITKNLWPKAE
jgi:multidrug efflux pump subunit AcrA (membrane-fusion protein)